MTRRPIRPADRLAAIRRRPWVRRAALGLTIPAVLLSFLAGYYYVSFSRLIDSRLHGERDTVLPRVFARPLELHRGQSLTARQLVDQLNDLGYAQRPQAGRPGEFAVSAGTVTVVPRSSGSRAAAVRVVFERQTTAAVRTVSRPAPQKAAPVRADRVLDLDIANGRAERLTLDAPVLTSLVSGSMEREKRRPVALSAIPPRMIQAVLAIEDRRFYDHPGIDPIGMLGAGASYVTGRRSYLAGGSTITQQLARNVFLPNFGLTLQTARERTLRRKALEIWVSIILTRRASKDEILEMYLNDIPLGQRGSFAIHGVAEASRLFFGKDVGNLTLSEAATIAGVIQSPSALSPFNNPARCRDRRNVVLGAMAEAGYITPQIAERASHEKLVVVERALDSEAPHFVDYVGQTLVDRYPGLTTATDQAVDVYTTLDLELQRLAQDAVRDGLARVDRLLARRRRRGRAEAALIAADPRTGEVLAFVGGRSYNQSQYNRAIIARRQPGSVFKPFVYLTAFEQAADQGRIDITPATITDDEPETFEFDDQVWTPENYESTYDGAITYRRALARSRNLGTIHVAERTGYQRIASFWQSLDIGTPPKPFPSIALGVFEATPFEIATAYTIFPNGGIIRPLKTILRVVRGGADVTRPVSREPRRVARPQTAFLVTNMMRSVLNEGTAASARANGFTPDAAGKTGTTNDLRDAWFAGFTPELLTVVWVGFDDNEPVGLSGAQAALPIWTQFMKAALAGQESTPFEVPDGIEFVEICPESGKLATPACPRTFSESFIAGTEPTDRCDLHQ